MSWDERTRMTLRDRLAWRLSGDRGLLVLLLAVAVLAVAAGAALAVANPGGACHAAVAAQPGTKAHYVLRCR